MSMTKADHHMYTKTTRTHINHNYFFGLFTLSKSREMHLWHCGRNYDTVQLALMHNAYKLV